MAIDPTPAESHSPDGETGPGPRFARGLEGIFLGPNGIRAAWRLLIALALFGAFAIVFQFSVTRIPGIRAWARAQAPELVTPDGQLFGEGIAVVALMLSVFVMTKVETRSFGDYGLPGREAFGKRFWQGLPYGFAMITLLMALIAALHGFALKGLALGGVNAARYGVLYGLGFILVGIFEELSFRGYMQATLASGIGFWPAAVALSILFGAIHLGNAGEAWVGALMAGCFGLLAAFSLRRTGNIWFAIGMHAAWDWGETYFYSVPDSGILAEGHLVNSSFHGPVWLTGGSVGPEGSMLVFVVLALSAAAIYYLFPAPRGES